MENCREPEDGDHGPDESFEVKPKVSKELQVKAFAGFNTAH